ncbi:MAG: response regulator transcription factor [Verrucomicrobia bacterium]|nr:response regulator transcription factor [Verrucomicrobiota bacterium]
MSDPKQPEKRRIFLVDDHPLVREWLGLLIEREPDLTICGEADDTKEALASITEAKPDIAIVDITLRTSHGLDLIKELQESHAELPILVLSMHDESLYAERVLRAGAKGYITKQEATKRVLVAIRQVLDGQIYLSEKMSIRMLNKLVVGRRDHQSFSIERLTDRELEVFQLIGRGHNTRKIAEELHLGIKTVESYRARIKDKLKLEDGTDLLRHAMQWAHNLKV